MRTLQTAKSTPQSHVTRPPATVSTAATVLGKKPPSEAGAELYWSFSSCTTTNMHHRNKHRISSLRVPVYTKKKGKNYPITCMIKITFPLILSQG